MEEERISQDSHMYARLLIGKVRHFMLKARQKELAPLHVTPEQAFILFILYNLGHKGTLGELAKHSGRAINTISKQLIIMEEDGLIKKVREIRKSNIVMVELTEKGIDIFKKSNVLMTDKRILSVLTEEERQLLILTMKKILSQEEK
jgi:DNA-binding MarR family transcriptional regulator